MQLKRRTAHALLFAGASTTGSIALRLVQLAILARLLTAGDFGLMAMLLVVVGLLSTLLDLGLSNAIIARSQRTSDTHLSAMYWLTLAAGCLLTVAMLIGAPLVAWFFEDPRLITLTRLMAPVFIILPAGAMHRVVLQRELRFGAVGMVEVIGVLVGAVTAIVLAMRGDGVLALVAGHLCMSAVQAIGFIIAGSRHWAPKLTCDVKSLRTHVSFGGLQAGERLVLFFIGHIDYIVIGRVLGPEMLGVYRIAYELAAVPHRRINQVVTRVTLPALAHTADAASLRRAYLAFVRWLSIIIVPLSIGLAITAGPTVAVLYGEAWADAATLVAALAFVGLGKGLLSPSGAAMLAQHRPDMSFAFNAALATLCSIAFALVAPIWGAVGVAIAYVIITACAFIAINGWLLPRLINLSMRAQLDQMSGPIVAGSFMAACVLITRTITVNLTAPSQLVSCIIVGGITYTVALLLIRRGLLRELSELARRRPSHSATASA